MTDRDILRGLAAEYAAVAGNATMAERAKLYRALNGLKPIRPVVLMDELPWGEFSECDELKLTCAGEFERECEWFFRMNLYRARHFPCDHIFGDFYPIHRRITIGSTGMEFDEDMLPLQHTGIAAHAYHDRIPDEAAIDQLHPAEITEDTAENDRLRERAEALFGDILPTRMVGLEYENYFTPWDDIARLHGVEPMLYDLIDEPDFMWKLATKVLEVRTAMLDRLEAGNFLEPTGAYIHSTAALADEIAPPEPGMPVTCRNQWGRGAAQIFVTVSPAMTEEYELPLQQAFLKRFPLTYYGCCEPLDKKMDMVRQLPNLRKISISPWANVESAAEQIGKDYVMAAKPNPALMAMDPFDPGAVRAEIRRILAAARKNGTPVELTLKDVSTIRSRPEILDEWARIAMDAVLE